MRIGPYEVLDEIGRGGMGAVYKARAPDGREVAVKVLLNAHGDGVARFERERRLIGSFTARDGFVPLIDSGVFEAGPYIVMPFLAGGTLRDRLERGPLAIEETIALGVALASALGRAHARGVVHRDLKPENVIYPDAGAEDGRAATPLIADLGLAKHWDQGARGASQSAGLSRSGTMRGTVGYMAPEQMEDAPHVGPPADVFSVGAILHECLTGRPAFEGSTLFEIMARIASSDAEPVTRARPETPPWLARAVARALARDASRRFADGGALLRALELREPGVPLWPLVASGAALLVLVAVFAGVVARRDRMRRALAPPPVAPVVSARVVPAPPPDDGDGSLAARKMLERSEELVARRDFEAGLAEASRAIELEPSNGHAWAVRGVARYQLGDADGAVADYTKAVELEPDLAGAWINRGIARANRKDDLDGAIADYTRAIELEPRTAHIWWRRGKARVKKGDGSGAIADYTRSIELDARSPAVWLDRGLCWMQLKRFEAAEQDFTSAIALDPTLAKAWLDRGLLRAQRGERVGAVADFERFLALSPDHPQASNVRSRVAKLKQAK